VQRTGYRLARYSPAELDYIGPESELTLQRASFLLPAGLIAGIRSAPSAAARRGVKARAMSTFADPQSLSHQELEEGTAFAPRFDAHGLVTAVAVDATSREVLMVAHMNAEALAKTLQTGEAHYYSRSRGKLWRKGETSGEVQKLIEMRTDCDQDAILLVVEQTGRGAACHTGRVSCFYRRVTPDSTLADAGVPRLFDPKDVYGP
jgi:phosphoribosyl-AMP cyclohydrolase